MTNGKNYAAFWKKRARNYENLQWAIKSGYLKTFLEAGEFVRTDNVLDIGTGTGIIAHTVSPFVRRMTGIDISRSMLSHAIKHKVRNEKFLLADARRLGFADESFCKVTARMVFHHILEKTQVAMNECYRVLRNGGRMIFSEGVPPTEYVKPFYIDMFKLKEERLTFMEDDLVDLMQSAGFGKIKKKIYWMRQASIINWLKNSGADNHTEKKILKMHLDLDEKGKRDYNMSVRNGDCFIDMKFVILIGEKTGSGF